MGESNPLLEALSAGKRQVVLPGATSQLRIITGVVVAVDSTNDLVDVKVGTGTEAANTAAIYRALPSLVTLTVGQAVYWLNTGTGGLVLGTKANQ